MRTNQFVQPTAPRVWSLREFKLRRECAGACALRFVPVTVKTNPFGPLFDGAWSDPRATAFQGGFPGLVSGLAASSLDGIGMHVDDVFNSGQSQAAGAVSETNYVTQFGVAPSPFRASIQDELTRIGSALTPDEVVKRAQAMSCAGCHRFSNGVNLGGGLTWPPSLGFTHVSERDVDVETEAGTGVRRYKLSPALVASFLPHRKRLVEDFLNDAPRPAKPPTTPLGGRFTH